MWFELLGCGTSTGVPVPGCTCAVCTSSNIKNQRLRTAGALRTEDHCILIDAGIDFRQQALRAKIAMVDAVLFTHSHSDHILGIDDLRGYNFKRQQPIPCYGTNDTLKEIERMFQYLFMADSEYEGGLLTSLALNRIQAAKPFEILGERFTPFLLWHGKQPVTGFRVRDLVYATDCSAVPEESKAIMRDAKYLLLDGLRYRPHKTHLTVDEAAVLADELRAEQTYLIHMSHDIEIEEANQKLPSHIRIAYDGMRIEL